MTHLIYEAHSTSTQLFTGYKTKAQLFTFNF